MGTPARHLTLVLLLGSRVATAQPHWDRVAPLDAGLWGHTATLLTDGRVLVVGGYDGTATVTTAQLYDPRSGTWQPVTPAAAPRHFHSAVMLRDGRVLLIGGTHLPAGGDTPFTELYQPLSGTFIDAGVMIAKGAQQTATLLDDGRVLEVGGYTAPSSSTSEAWDGPSGRWQALAPPPWPMGQHCAARLADGRVLVAGGASNGGSTVLADVALFDPRDGGWTVGARMLTARRYGALTALADGRLLASGGIGDGGETLAAAELYDPALDVWRDAGTAGYRKGHTSTLLPNGEVVLVGGFATAVAVTFNGADFVTAPQPAISRWEHTATLLANGRLLVVAGGLGTSSPTAEVELYSWATSSFGPQLPVTAGSVRTLTALPDGRMLAVGGTTAVDLFDPPSGISSQAAPLAVLRYQHTATLLPSGRVLVAGGRGSNPIALSSCELFEPDSGIWLDGGQLHEARYWHQAQLLPSGAVLTCGGLGSDGGALSTCERYDEARGTWSNAPSMQSARRGFAMHVLPSGRALVLGGYGGSGSAERFPGRDGGWELAVSAPLLTWGEPQTALLETGEVLVAGGCCPVHGGLSRVDPETGAVLDAGSLLRPMAVGWAQRLATGDVLFGGGTDVAAGPTLRSAMLVEVPGFHVLDAGESAGTVRVAALMPTGDVLFAGSSASLQVYSSGLRPIIALRPRVNPITSPVTGRALALFGSGFAGRPEGGSGSWSSSPSETLVVRLERQEGGPVAYARVLGWTASTAQIELPVLLPGWYWLRVSVSGAQSDAVAFLVPPVASDGGVDGGMNGGADGGADGGLAIGPALRVDCGCTSSAGGSLAMFALAGLVFRRETRRANRAQGAGG